MKVYISVDVEGLTGSTSQSPPTSKPGAWCRGRTDEARGHGAALGAIDAGADEVYIKDAHDSGRNMDITGFPKQCRFIRDWTNSPDSMIGGIDKSFDAVLFVGYHSPAGFDGNPLSHTMNRGNNYVKFNGELCSEFLMHAFYAAELGVPSVFLSGDRASAPRPSLGSSGSAVTSQKKDSVKATISITPEEACERIRQAAREGVENRASCHIQLPETLTMEISFRIITEPIAPATIRRKQTGPYTVEIYRTQRPSVATARIFIL